MRLVPFHTDGAPPSYFVHGGLVFTPVTVSARLEWEGWWELCAWRPGVHACDSECAA